MVKGSLVRVEISSTAKEPFSAWKDSPGGQANRGFIPMDRALSLWGTKQNQTEAGTNDAKAMGSVIQ